MASLVALAVAGLTTQVGSRHKGLAQRAFLGTVFAWQAASTVEGLTREPSAA